jgi:hypothetical protein
MPSQVIWHGGYSSVTALGFGPYWFSSGLLSDAKKTMSTMGPISGINEINSHQPINSTQKPHSCFLAESAHHDINDAKHDVDEHGKQIVIPEDSQRSAHPRPILISIKYQPPKAQYPCSLSKRAIFTAPTSIIPDADTDCCWK